MADRKYYVICASGCRFESMTKEQILTAITQAVNEGTISDVDSGFVTTLKEQNRNAGLSFWVGTQAEYNALPEKVENCFYITTDDTVEDDLFAKIEELNVAVKSFEGIAKQINELKVKTENGLSWYDVTTTGTDLNNYRTSGVYHFPQANAPLNLPSTNMSDGWLVVLANGSAKKTVKQIWLREGTANNNDWQTFVRTDCGTGFSAWKEFATTDVTNALSARVSTLENSVKKLLYSGTSSGAYISVNLTPYCFIIASIKTDYGTFDVPLTRVSTSAGLSVPYFCGNIFASGIADSTASTRNVKVVITKRANYEQYSFGVMIVNGETTTALSAQLTAIYGIA